MGFFESFWVIKISEVVFGRAWFSRVGFDFFYLSLKGLREFF